MTNAIWHRRPTLDDLQAMSRGTAVEHLGIEFTEVGDDYIAAKMPVDRRTIQPYGLLHGGASVLLAETVGSSAAHCCVDGAAAVTVGIEINANHIRGVREGWVHGTGTAPAHRTNDSAVGDPDRRRCRSARMHFASYDRSHAARRYRLTRAREAIVDAGN